MKRFDKSQKRAVGNHITSICSNMKELNELVLTAGEQMNIFFNNFFCTFDTNLKIHRKYFAFWLTNALIFNCYLETYVRSILFSYQLHSEIEITVVEQASIKIMLSRETPAVYVCYNLIQ